MKKKHVDADEVKNIYDINLDDPLHMRICLEQWDTIQSLSENHLKVKDLFIEMEERWNRSRLTDQQRDSIRLYLMEGGYTQKDAGEALGIGTRAVAKLVEEGIDIMTRFDANG